MRIILLLLIVTLVNSINIDEIPQIQIQQSTDGDAVGDCTGECQKGAPESQMSRVMGLKIADWAECAAVHECPIKMADSGPVKCTNKMAGSYQCCNTDLLSFVSLKSAGAGGDGNDCWGWTDPLTRREYAIYGVVDGTSFIDITNPVEPVVLGFLKTHTVKSSWRDIKVYQNHAFIISEAKDHGMQVFDLTQLRGLTEVTPSIFDEHFDSNAIRQLTETAWYGQFGSCHNIAINEDSGYAYGVGSKTCSGGLHMVNIKNPRVPTYAGCYSADGYVHDTQCVNYTGPDPAYVGKEVCFCYDEDTLTIVDVTRHGTPVTISRTPYTGSQYTHQGWLLPGNTHLFLDDELDELYNANHHTRTMVWNVTTLASPNLTSSFYSQKEVIDHNLYTLGNRVYQANYCGGLRILDSSRVATGGLLSEVGYFDIAPTCNTTKFLGSWSNYPYFPSGTIIVSGIESGLYMVKYNGADKC